MKVLSWSEVIVGELGLLKSEVTIDGDEQTVRIDDGIAEDIELEEIRWNL